MELALSLGDSSKALKFLDNTTPKISNNKDVGFSMGLGSSQEIKDPVQLQLDLLPFTPVPVPRRQIPFPWLQDNHGSGREVKRLSAEETEEGENSGASSFQMDFGNRNGRGSKRDMESDDDENGLTRKKLRLSKEQSAFLEESFKEHNTLNPKQKIGLAKQLNLRPRQVEVWFQNRRARTKLKQTEVDCEYLKRCCETLTEENRRLQKELQELRTLKTSQPFYMQLPATTLTMCPSCERVATTTTTKNPVRNNLHLFSHAKQLHTAS
ncbi:homeobox-leucine zipper protein HAT14 isoform X2 [Euphorbia lathyris]|uniref:homeobox-leucine zipper protein HAT14 isoform X2 n=1 Tax=Euphorbia lathyris TaxID=212925 RepID=UPI0033133F12